MKEKDKQNKLKQNDKAAKYGEPQKGEDNYITGGKNKSTRPEQGPDMPAEERTAGIP